MRKKEATLLAASLLVAGVVATLAGCGGRAEDDDTGWIDDVRANEAACPDEEQEVRLTILTPEAEIVEDGDLRLDPSSDLYEPTWDTNNAEFDPLEAGWVGGLLFSNGYFPDPDDNVRHFGGGLTVEGICPSLDDGVQLRLLHKGPVMLSIRRVVPPTIVPDTEPTLVAYRFGVDVPVDPVITVRELRSDVERLSAGELRLTVVLPSGEYPPPLYNEAVDTFPADDYWTIYGDGAE